MVIRRRSGAVCLNAPLRIWLLAGVVALIVVAGAVSFATRSVQAHAVLTQPAASVPPSIPAVLHAAPESPKPGGTVAAVQHRSIFHGLASWYGNTFNGRKTASGERFDMTAMTACHPSLPFGSLVRVVNLKNGRSVIVRITDRGELAEGRIIDLSFAAAEKLAMTNSGLAPVVLNVLSRGPR